jgi:putative oxidoreductase
MATSYRPDEHGSQDDQPTSTEPARDMDATADAQTRIDPVTGRERAATSEPDTIREPDTTGDDPGATRTTAGTAAAPAPAASADHAEATTRIPAHRDADTTVDHGVHRAETTADHDAQRDEPLDARRDAAAQLAIARGRNRMTTDIGLLILRVMNLVMFLHGLAKVIGYSGFRQSVAGNSFGALAPDLFAILVVAGQLALPIAIAFGLFTRIAGLLQAIMMAVIWVLFPLAGGLISSQNGGINGESAYLFVAVGLTLFFTGPGRISLDQVIFGKGAERRATRRGAKKVA